MGVIIVVLLVALVLLLISIYNRLVTARNAAKNAFAQIDVQLTRRHDLIPNLVEVAKGYLQHERQTLEAVIQARNAAVAGLKAAAANPAERRGGRRPGRRRESADRRARAPVRAGRGLPGPQGQPDHDAALRGADLHREQGGVRAAVLQRRRARTTTTRARYFRTTSSRQTSTLRRCRSLEIESPAKREVPKVSFG